MAVAKFATTTRHGAMEGKTQTRLADFYNLDVIISVGYRVKSKRGVEFRRWANSILKQYILEGYAINNKRLEVLQKTVEIQSNMLSIALNIDGSEVLQAVNQYIKALTLLDQYDNLIKDTDDKTTIFNAQKQVLSKYEELILQNG